MALEAITNGHQLYNHVLGPDGSLQKPIPGEVHHPLWKWYKEILDHEAGVDDILRLYGVERLMHKPENPGNGMDQAYQALSRLRQLLKDNQGEDTESHGTLLIFNYESGPFDRYYATSLNGGPMPSERGSLMSNLESFVNEVYGMATHPMKHDGAILVDDDGYIRQKRISIENKEKALAAAYNNVWVNGGEKGFIHDAGFEKSDEIGKRCVTAVTMSFLLLDALVGYNPKSQDFGPIFLKNGQMYDPIEGSGASYQVALESAK
jgi:hypothetical protein